MKKFQIQVPDDIGYLSEWSDLNTKLPPGKIIVNKVICGCGMTDYYLTNDMPVILASPRKELILSKLNDDRTSHAYYFDRSDKSVPLRDSKSRLNNYIDGLFGTAKVPKILTTYDSLKHVVDFLIEKGILEEFIVVGDEMTCIITDAKMKGPTAIEIVELIDNLPNRCVFITATPMKEPYLDETPVFKDMTYVDLIWNPAKMLPVFIKRQKMTSTTTALCDIIAFYREHRYFQTKIENGQQVNSVEMVAFVNSISDIISVIKKAGLKPAETCIICAENDDNRKKLRRIGMNIGHFPGKKDYRTKNKTFTFATRCSFEGADLHSDTATTYIFADSNKDNLALDISIDLPQIIGRCRTKSNPFRSEILYYYKTTNSFDYNEAKNEIEAKLNKTTRLISQYNGWNDQDLMEKLKDAQLWQGYSKDYLDVVKDANGAYVPRPNILVWLADVRTIEIRKDQYATQYSILQYLNQNGYNTTDYYNNQTAFGTFYCAFDSAGSFEEKMKIYAEACNADLSIKDKAESVADIPLKYKMYYNELGLDVCRALSFKEANIKQQIDFKNRKADVRQQLDAQIQVGDVHTLEYLKRIIQDIYNNLNISKTAKATDIKEYYDVSSTKISNYGIRKNAYKILKRL